MDAPPSALKFFESNGVSLSLAIGGYFALTLKIPCAKQLSGLLGILSMASSLNLPQPAYAQAVEQDLLCQRFPLNSRCTGYTQVPQQERPNLGQGLLGGANQVTKVRLGLSGPDDEWIRIEMSNGTNGNVLTAYHTKRVRRELLSNLSSIALRVGAEQLAREAINGYDGPVPVPDVNFYRWADHETRRIVFVPDGCSENSPALLEQSQQLGCDITGTTSITLPSGTDIRAGLLTIEYAEEELVRTVTFRVPS